MEKLSYVHEIFSEPNQSIENDTKLTARAYRNNANACISDKYGL